MCASKSLPRRGKGEFATLQLGNSDEGARRGTAHLDIKHLVKNCRMDKGGYSCSVAERLRGFLDENKKKEHIYISTWHFQK